jgi:type I restriction enzyme M protein
MDSSQIGKRAWSYAGVLQDAGLSCFEYVEQLTLLLFLKMADQLTEQPYNRAPIVPPKLGWKARLPPDGAALEDQYRLSLEKLGVKPGMLGVIFKGARCEINNPARLRSRGDIASKNQHRFSQKDLSHRFSQKENSIL